MNTYRCSGHEFTDVEHMSRCSVLLAEKAEGRITELEVYPHVEVGLDGLPYTPLFAYRKNDGTKVYEEVLDFTSRSTMRLIRKAWENQGPGTLEIVAKRKGKWKVIRRVLPTDGGDVDGNR